MSGTVKNSIIKLLSALIALGIFSVSSACAKESPAGKRGVWVTAFTPLKVMSEKKNADRLIEECLSLGIDHIYIQVFRGGKAYYNSELTDSWAFRQMMAGFGEDPLKYLVRTAHKNNIRIYAWMNPLCVGQNYNSPILKKYGHGIITRDKFGRIPFDNDEKDALDKYFIREDQIFLEPGDKRVVTYMTAIAGEIMTQYPEFDGVHLDYIRYPYIVPFSPGARFDSHGISYGFTPANVQAFKAATGLDPLKMDSTRENFKKWDDWRRNNVTRMVSSISKAVKGVSPGAQLSCTIVSSIERTYYVNFQDWTKWLYDGTVDYVTVMSYTDDPKYLALSAQSILLPEFKDRMYIGLGPFIFKDNAGIFQKELEITSALDCAGVAFFSFDDIADSPEFGSLLKK